MGKRSKYQQKAIKNFYENREAIALQRAQELVTELYLTTGKARARHWKTLATHLASLGVKEQQIEHLCEQDKPELVATLIQKFMEKQ